MHGFPFSIHRDPDDPDAGDLFVDAVVDGRAYPFILDTGASISAMREDEELARLAPVGTKVSGGVFGKSEDELVEVAELQLGPIVRNRLRVARSKHPRSRNLIGMDVLRDLRLGFDFAAGFCHIAPGPEWDGIEARHPLTLDSVSHPFVQVGFGEASASAVWDSGAGMTVVDLAFVAAHPTCFAEVGKSVGTDSNGTQMETPLLMMLDSKIGDCEFPRHRVVAVDLSALNSHSELPVNMILGFTTLSLANWVFDFPARVWGVRRLAPPDASSP